MTVDDTPRSAPSRSDAPGWREAGRRYWHSLALRLTLTHGLLVALSTTILLSFVYMQVVGVLRAQLLVQIQELEQALVEQFDTGGVDALVGAIEQAVAQQRGHAQALYLLLDSDDRPLAGNMAPPSPFPSYAGPVETRVVVDGQPIPGYLSLRHLPSGETLLTGHGASRIKQVSDMIAQGIGVTVALAVLLVLLGTYVFRHELEMRVGAVRRTARQIGPGQLSLRVPSTTLPDEFANLDHDVNAMLDRIERLMTGVRDVSDSLAHDLRTPLMRMQARLRSVQHPGASRADLARAVDAMALELEQLGALLGRLLQISELEAGVRRQAFGPCRLDQVAADVVDLYGALAEERQIRLDLWAAQPISVQGDAQLLANACANLVDNALKYARSQVVVRVQADAQSACLSVEDDGPGLPPEHRQRLGERFYRPDLSREGLGLGLASVKAIASLHGGRLRFGAGSATAGAGGLKAELVLPARDTAAGGPAPAAAEHALGTEPAASADGGADRGGMVERSAQSAF